MKQLDSFPYDDFVHIYDLFWYDDPWDVLYKYNSIYYIECVYDRGNTIKNNYFERSWIIDVSILDLKLYLSEKCTLNHVIKNSNKIIIKKTLCNDTGCVYKYYDIPLNQFEFIMHECDFDHVGHHNLNGNNIEKLLASNETIKFYKGE